MISRYRNLLKLIALLTLLCVMQIYVFAGGTNSAMLNAPSVVPSPQVGGTLRTTGGQPVIVNGNSVSPGTTILTGSTIETGPGVGATISLGSLGSVEIAPNTKVVLDFSNGQIKVTLTEGCLIVSYKSGVYAEIDTAQGKVAASDPHSTTAGVLDVCQPPGAPSAIVNQGAAANAGAGAGGAASSGVNRALVAALLGIGGVVVTGIILAGGGGNPSPSTP